MRKYLTLFALSWQKQLEVRSEFFFERTRSLSILFSLYFLWGALLKDGQNVMGYEKDQLLTYVLLMTLLRAWVLGCVTDRIPMEISKGKLTDVLLKPFSHMGYWATQDVANKSLNLVSAVFEVGVFMLIVSAPFVTPHEAVTWIMFVGAVLGGMTLYFQMSYMLGVMGFWTSQSWGPRFLFEILLEFCAGAYFPIDLLPATIQKFLSYLPFPYLIFFPISIFLDRLTPTQILQGFVIQAVWIGLLFVLVSQFWKMGLRKYAAEGR